MRNYNMAGNMQRPCGCASSEPAARGLCPDNEYVVGMAYVPWQNFSTVYEPDRALEAGTIFPELDKPFLAVRGGVCR